jgi:anti-anti-sigma factor
MYDNRLLEAPKVTEIYPGAESIRCAFISDSADEFPLISVVGEIDVASALKLENALNALGHTAPAFGLDMSACQYLDSSIIAVLVRVSRRFNKKFSIVIPEGHKARRILRIVGLDSALPIEPSINEARRHSRRENPWS